MKIGILGGGSVGQTIGSRLIALGHQVQIGVRNPSDAELAKPRNQGVPLAEWVAKTGGGVASFADAAGFGEMVFNVTSGDGAVAAVTAAKGGIGGKILVDVSNPLDFSRGFPPTILPAYAAGVSLGEAVQAAVPEARVVKAFNTIAATMIVDPGQVVGAHDLLIAGNDAGAKAEVVALARSFGWQNFVDLGDISGAGATEHYLPLILRLFSTLKTAAINIRVVH